MSKFHGAKAGYEAGKQILKKFFGKTSKVSPTITSVKPSTTVREKGIKASVEKAKSDEFVKRIRLKDAAEKKLKTGKQMMREAQKERKKLIDTGRAFQFRHGKSLHAMEPGEKSKFKDSMKKQKPDKRFYTGKELEQQEYFKYKKDRVKKMGGGMMGRRMGYSEGKLAVTPREKRLAAQYGDKKRITRGDVITAAKKKSGERMQASVGGGAGQTRKEKILFKLNKNIKNVKEKMKGPTLTKSSGIKTKEKLEPLRPPPPKKTSGKPLKEKP